MAVSLDIANAFKTLPYSCIFQAIMYQRVPLHLRKLIELYLIDSMVRYRANSLPDARFVAFHRVQSSHVEFGT